MRNNMFVLLVLALLAIIPVQAAQITGRWLLTRAEANGNIQEPYIFITFLENGRVEIMGKDIGEWAWHSNKHVLSVHSRHNKYLNGEAAVKKLTPHLLLLKKDGVHFYYQKIYPDKIRINNQNAKLSGLWNISRGRKPAGQLRLHLPDKFEFIEGTTGGADTTTGTWLYQRYPNDESIVFVSFSPLRGKILIDKKTGNRFEFLSKGIRYTAERNKQ